MFLAIFNGRVSEKSNSIDLPDCEYEEVLKMLWYMYSGEAELKESNVMQVLYRCREKIHPTLAC